MANENDKNEGNGTPESGGGAEFQSFESSGKPAVAAAPGKMMFVLLAAAVFVFIVVRSLFFGGEAPKEKPQPKQKEVVAAAPAILPLSTTTPGTLTAPPPPPPVAPAPPLPAPPPPNIKVNGSPTSEELKARIKSPMVVTGGSGLANALTGKKAAPGASNDPNTAFARSLEPSKADRVEATSAGNLNISTLQGKFISGILETAINTDLPGSLRAIVSHDVYAEAGRSILIPKGSRLIGVYNSSIRHGQGRVFIIWTRVIRPDGIDIQIDSPGIDSLGRAGVAGDVDNKYFEMFSTALLTSTLDIGVAAAGQGLFGNQQQTTTQGNGGVTTTSSPTSAAMQEAVQNVGTVGNTIVNSAVNLQPTVNVDQGTPINVFVNKDLVFPTSVTGKGRFVE